MQNLSYKKEFDLHENKPVGGTHFSYKRFSTKTCFDTEAKANSEMAYSITRRYCRVTSVTIIPASEETTSEVDKEYSWLLRLHFQ